MKYKAIAKGPDSSFATEVINYEHVKNVEHAIEEARRDLLARSVPGATIALYTVHKDTDLDLVSKWKVNDNFQIIKISL